MHMALRYGNAAMARDTRQHKYVAPGLFAQPRKGRMPQDVGDKIRDLTNFQRLTVLMLCKAVSDVESRVGGHGEYPTVLWGTPPLYGERATWRDTRRHR